VRLAKAHDGLRAESMTDVAEAWARGDLEGVAAAAARAEERGLGMLALDAWELAVRLSFGAGSQDLAMRVRDRSDAWHAHLRVTPASTGPVLTDREWQVADLAATGSSDKAISAALGISVRTVHAHLRNVYTKLKVEGRADLRDHPFFRRGGST
jgi:DNA-binding NarL/FixJ family response regulator